MTMGTSILGLPGSAGTRDVWSAGGRRNIFGDGDIFDDGAGVRGADGRVRRRVPRVVVVIVVGARHILEMGQRLMVGVGGQPVVDESFDHTAAPKRAADVVPTAV